MRKNTDFCGAFGPQPQQQPQLPEERTPSMRIAVVTIMKNESDLLPFFLRHYAFADEIHVHDNESTDDTPKILAANPKVKRHLFKTGGKNDTPAKRKIRNEWYKTGTNAKWIICVDTDELLWHPRGVRVYLHECLSASITLPQVRGYQMFDERPLPADDGRLLLTDWCKHGVEDRVHYSKRAAFQSCVDIHYGPGAHHCSPTGNVVHSPTEELLLFHYKWLSYADAMKKLRWRAGILSDTNKLHGWSYKTEELGDEKWLPFFKEMMAKRQQVIP